MSSMSPEMAERTVNHYLCQRCWGHLVEYYIDGESVVQCANDECDGSGFVTKYYVDEQRQHDRGNMYDVRRNLQSSGVIEKPEFNEGDTIKSLGF